MINSFLSYIVFFFSSRRRNTRFSRDWSSDVCSSDLVRTLAPCKNVVGDWAWVDVGCDETVCVDLVIPTFLHCVLRTITGAWFGTVDPPEGEERVRDVMGKEVEAAVDALRRIAEKLPEEGNMPAPPTIEEFERELKQFEEAAGKPQA